MSTLPGLASKGERGKSKFQSLDINSLYRVSLGESVEKQQQKNTSSLKHGMQSLGKVPSARRPPANLPSLKSEHSGSDTAVSLVPSNGSGWGKQETTSSTTTTNTISSSTSTNTNAAQLTAHQAAIALPVTTTIPPPNKPHTATVIPATGDKSWSSVMTGNETGAHPPPYQSPQFQHEFPSLSAGDGVPVRSGTDIQYGPGPSLRPQTEGSWILGGSRGPPDGAAKVSSAPLGAPPQLAAPAGQPLPAQYRGFMPPFMYRGNGNNFPSNGHGTPPITTQPATTNSAPNVSRGKTDQRGGAPKSSEVDDLAHRPIIKEEELIGMDNLTGDMGWAMHDDIDYNQKLAFSDEESKSENREHRRQYRMQREHESHHSDPNDHHKAWSGPNQSLSSNQQQQQQQQQQPSRNRQEDDEISAQRRRQQLEVASAIERAKQRKEEEEKKYLESKQNAAKKLQKMNEKSSKLKRDKESDETIGTINPASIPPQTIAPVPILLPEWERERDRDRPKSEPEEKPKVSNRESAQSDFRQLTQIEGRSSFQRKDSRSAEKDQVNTPNFSRQFQNNLPPRFQKQQQLNASGTMQSQPPYQYENRWSQGPGNKTSPNTRKSRDSEEKDREEDRFRRNDDNYRSSHRTYPDSGRKSSNDNRHDIKVNVMPEDHDFKKEKEEEKREKNRDRHESKSESFDNLPISRQNSDEWHNERRMDRFERPQRPDSRDSRASRESRDSARQSEPREYIGSWPESHYEDTYEEKKKEHRMQVPGPITKEKIEADDLRNEKRNLTQLKRGTVIDKKLDKDKTPEKDSEDMWNLRKNKEAMDGPRAWADAISPSTVAPENPKFEAEIKHPHPHMESVKVIEEVSEEKKEKVSEKERDDKRTPSANRGRSDSQSSRNSGWGGGSGGVVYRSWKKGGSSGRGSRGGPRSQSGKSNEWLGSESDASMDDNQSNPMENPLLRSPKASKKIERDERENEKDKEKGKDKNEKNSAVEKKSEKSHRDYIPRGEPSRHGRGGSNTFRGGGRGGGCKRIDGYGPPTVKSPFSHTEEKEKKCESDSMELTSDDKSKGPIHSKDNFKLDDRGIKRKPDNRRVKRPDDEISDNSDDSKDKMRKGPKSSSRQNPQSNQLRRNIPSSGPPRSMSDKRGGFGGPTRNDPLNRQNSSGSLRSVHMKDKEKDNTNLGDMKNKEEGEGNDLEQDFVQSDSDGFQEVKSKKTGKIERPPRVDEKPKLQNLKPEKDNKPERKGKPNVLLSQQQIANIPSLMATPINPPANIPQPQGNKGQFERPRQNKLPPRLVKQRENKRLHQAQMQGMCDMNDMNKVNPNMYSMKEGGGVAPGGITNAWEKPLANQLRGNMDQDGVLSVGLDSCKNLEPSQGHCQNSTNTEDKTVLDGSKPLNTIIFENTNFKSTPGCRSRNDKPRTNKMEDNIEGTNVLSNFNKPIGELLNKNDKNEIQMQLNFNKEDNVDMKLDFFESEISHLTDDKTSKSIGLPRTMHGITSSNSTISSSTADALNIKIQSVKKVWETMPTVIEHANVGQDDGNSFPTFGPDPNSLDPSTPFIKGSENAPDDNHEVYSPSPNNQNSTNGTTNVCKVKPTQQVAGSTGQTVLSTGTHQQHSAMVGPGLMGHPLSPPPMQPVIGGGVGLGQPPQQFTANQHLGYQASLGGSTQYGMPAIPSPPTVLYNSTQQLQAQTGLYGAFQIDQSQVMNNQGRSQYSQYSYGLSQAASSPYSQSMYLQTAQPHAPPTAQPPPDLYTNMSNYRIPATGPFGQNQQLNNPTTVLISSTSNSLMSATVKPSNQQISAIGTKAGGVGQAYQQQSQQGQQLYMTYDPTTMQANYLQNTGVMQRPGGPVQNNVVQALQPSALQPSSSYYSGSTGGQTGYFQQPGNSTLPSAQMPQHQASYGLQGSVFGTHNQSHTNAGMQNYGSPFLSGPMQLAAAAISAQQYRSAAQLPNAYMKNVGNQQMTDQSGRSQQLKSPGGQQEVLSSVFNSGSQIPSPKSRQTCKQPPPQPSPTAQHKYLYSTVSNQQPGQTRYPTPIQRPVVNYQQLGGSVQNNGNQKHRNPNSSGNRTTPRQYYGGQGGNMNTQNDKNEESKLNDNVGNVPNSSNNNTSTSNIVTKSGVPSAVQPSDKSETGKEENSVTISKD